MTITIGTPTLADDLSLAPQPRKVLAHLLSGKTLSRMEGLFVYSIQNLPDCIKKIRGAGYNIATEQAQDGTGKEYTRYRLLAKSVAKAA
jgi:hypothetical protein